MREGSAPNASFYTFWFFFLNSFVFRFSWYLDFTCTATWTCTKVWTSLTKFDQVWPSLNKFEQVWTRLFCLLDLAFFYSFFLSYHKKLSEGSRNARRGDARTRWSMDYYWILLLLALFYLDCWAWLSVMFNFFIILFVVQTSKKLKHKETTYMYYIHSIHGTQMVESSSSLTPPSRTTTFLVPFNWPTITRIQGFDFGCWCLFCVFCVLCV